MDLSQIDSYIGTWESDLINNKQMWSKNCIKMLGLSLLDKPSWDDFLAIVHPEDHRQVIGARQSHIEHNTEYKVEFRIMSGTDDNRWMRLVGEVERDAEGKPQAMRGTLQNISDQKCIEIKLLESESRLQEALDHACIAYWELARGSDTAAWSKQICQLMGLPSDFQPSSDKPYQLINDNDRQAVIDSLQHNFDTGEDHQLEYIIKRHDNGEERWIECRGKAVLDSYGVPEKLTGFIQDITERKQAEHQLRIAATAFESQEGMMITDANCNVIKVNSAFTRITGYCAEDVIGQNPRLLSSSTQGKDFYVAMWNSINDHGKWQGEIWNRRKVGEVYPQHLTITAVKNQSGVVTNYVGTLLDITLSKAAAEKIEKLAYYDPLTSLPNRRLLQDRLQQALSAGARTGKKGAVLFIDLDKFKNLNDTQGHETGDLLLQQVAERLGYCVREGDTIARLGGDEFIILLENLNEHLYGAAAETEVIAKKILALINNEPYQLDKYLHINSSSIGVAIFNNQDQSVEELLRHSDIAMYEAKNSGGNAVRFFDPYMQAKILDRADLVRELRKAIDGQQLELYYQLQVDSSQCLLGVEALLRWQHPNRGLISPIHFIELAEETGLILPIGQWVLETACAQLKAWQNSESTRDLTLSVNVSAKQFLQADFINQVRSIIQNYAITPSLLKLELTESMLLENIDDTIVIMSALQTFGVNFSLDDFGTGYSSLQYLKRLPLDQLKIDQSFVRDIATDPSDRVIVSTIIAMAENLELSIIAEGVETEQQRNILFNQGCKHYQGYLIGKPMPIEQLESIIIQMN